MADYKYMLQDKIKPGPKVGARETTYKASEVLSNGSAQVAFPKGYQDPLRTTPAVINTDGKIKPLLATGTDGGFITKTETTAEHVSPPTVTSLGNNPLSIIQPVVSTVSLINPQSTKSDEYITKTQTEVTRTYIKGPVSNFYWWRKPSYSGRDSTYDYNRPNDNGVNKYNTSYEVGSVITTPTQGQALPNVVTSAAVLVPAIDSREVAQRYGGLSTSPSPVAAYVPAIDSREAAKKYRGQAL